MLILWNWGVPVNGRTVPMTGTKLTQTTGPFIGASKLIAGLNGDSIAIFEQS